MLGTLSANLTKSQVIGASNGATECNGTIVKLPGLPEMFDYGQRPLKSLP